MGIHAASRVVADCGGAYDGKTHDHERAISRNSVQGSGADGAKAPGCGKPVAEKLRAARAAAQPRTGTRNSRGSEQQKRLAEGASHRKRHGRNKSRNARFRPDIVQAERRYRRSANGRGKNAAIGKDHTGEGRDALYPADGRAIDKSASTGKIHSEHIGESVEDRYGRHEHADLHAPDHAPGTAGQERAGLAFGACGAERGTSVGNGTAGTGAPIGGTYIGKRRKRSPALRHGRNSVRNHLPPDRQRGTAQQEHVNAAAERRFDGTARPDGSGTAGKQACLHAHTCGKRQDAADPLRHGRNGRSANNAPFGERRTATQECA